VKPLRILILGGTGFIGPHEVTYALARGHKLTLFNRGKSPHAWPGEVEELIGDRNTGDLKALAGREWDVCIDNPTTLPFWVRDAGEALHGKVRQYIFISTISVYAANDAPADETAAVAPYAGKDPMAETADTLKAHVGELYGPLKAVSEKEAEKQFPGMTTIIRPGLIAGPGDETDRFTYWPVRLARGGEVLAPGDGSDPVQLIDARDLAEWTIRMAERSACSTPRARPRRRRWPGCWPPWVRRPSRTPRSPGSPPTSWRRRRSRPGATCRCGSRPAATPPASPAATSTRPWPPA
jgi:2'-hydroxyisoflavone reductase